MSADGWLATVQETIHSLIRSPDGHSSYLESQLIVTGLKANDRGFLSMTLADYLMFLEWVAQRPGLEGQAKMTSGLAPLFDRLGLEPEMWRELVSNFSYYYRQAGKNGKPQVQREQAAIDGKRFYSGQGISQGSL